MYLQSVSGQCTSGGRTAPECGKNLKAVTLTPHLYLHLNTPHYAREPALTVPLTMRERLYLLRAKVCTYCAREPILTARESLYSLYPSIRMKVCT